MKNHNQMMYGSWDLEWDRQNFLSFWMLFFPFPPRPLKYKVQQTNFSCFGLFFALSALWQNRKSKKTPGNIIILPICTINDNHMRYGSWDMEHDTEFFVILDCLLPFYPCNNPKNQNFEKMKKKKKNTWRYYDFTQVHHKWQLHEVWFMRCQVQWT